MAVKNAIQSKSGFTLMELVMALGVVSIMAVIAIPQFMKWLPQYRLRSATRDIVSCLEDAKMRAIKENSDVIVSFHTKKSEVFIDNGEGGGTAGNRIRDGGELTIRKVTMSADTNLSNKNAAAMPLNFGFNSRGVRTTRQGTLKIEDDKSKYRTIVFSSAGNVRVVH